MKTITILTVKTETIINQHYTEDSYTPVGYYDDAFALQADIDYLVHEKLSPHQQLLTQEIELNKYYGL